MIKKFAYTFFFGYLETKWKRLARVLSIAFIHIFYVFADGVRPFSFNEYSYLLSNYMPIYIMVISVISWVIKPFMVDK